MAGAAAPAQLMPATAAEAAVALRDAGAVRIRGGGTKLAWGRPVAADAELRTARLDALVAHNAGDLTAVVQAGLPLARAQAELAAAGQMLALDPPDGGATIGGVVATGDSGPLRHRYGAPRDLVLGVQVALPDGTVARAGSQVIKNVAGYDLAKLMSGACGTLGLLTELTVRLHPRPEACCTAVGRGGEPHAVARAASALAHLPLEADALDLRWEGEEGAVLARFGGRAAPARGAAALR
ncbi:FAD-binding protein, partial [Conexibacter stalactiti]